MTLSACNKPPVPKVEKSDNGVIVKESLDPNGTLNLNLGAEPTYLNPILSTDVPSSTVGGMVFSGLMRVNSDLEMIPDLAASYSISKDGLVYTFKLRKNVKWHDGAPFTANDVKFTFDKILDPKTNTVRRSNYIIDKKKVKFEVIDNHTFRAILPKPFAPFLTHMGMGILPKHLLENEDINTTKFNRNPVGTGPFVFQLWKPDQYVKLTRNDHYFRSIPKLKGLILKIIPDEQTALVALKKGEIDQGGIPSKDFKKLKNHPKFTIYRYDDLNYTYLGFNLKHPFFKNLKVRQAIAHAINKKAIVKGVLKGFGNEADLPSSPVSWAYPLEANIEKLGFNPDKGRQLLAEEGFKLNTSTNTLEKDGKAFEFRIITNKGNKDREKTAQIIQRYLADIGIKVNIQLMEWSSFIKIVNAPIDPKKYDAVILGWSLGLDPDGYAIWHSSQYPKGFNFIGYQNSHVDELIVQGRQETIKSKRKSIYGKIFNKIGQEVPYVFLYYPEVLVGVNKRVRGLSKPGPAGLLNEIENVYVVN